MTPDVVAFWAFAVLTLIGALLTILSRNAVHSAVWLIASLLGTAGLFLLQKAEFLFAVQIILYVGGIMVLFLFVIMLVNLGQQANQRQFSGQWWLGTIAVALVAFEAAFFIWKGLPKLPAPAEPAAVVEGNTERLADLLFTEYLVPFEVASLLLLAAVVGSVLMAKGRRA